MKLSVAIVEAKTVVDKLHYHALVSNFGEARVGYIQNWYRDMAALRNEARFQVETVR